MQMLYNKLLATSMMCSTLNAEPLDLLYGHFEIQADYDLDSGWWMGVSYNLSDDFNDRSQIVRLEADETTIVAPPRAQTTSTSGTSFITPSGEPLWLLPQGFQTGHHYLGSRIIIDPYLFQTRVGDNYSNAGTGTVAFRLTSVTGSGPDRGGAFALWEADFVAGNIVYLNSADGISEDDEIPLLPAGAHSHFNWGFSAPGEYHIEIEAYGRLRPSGTLTSTSSVFTFVIPHSGTVDSFTASLCSDENDYVLLLGDSSAGVAYGESRAMVEATTAAESGESAWTCPLQLHADGWELADVAGASFDTAANGAGANSYLQLVAHHGPGEIFARTAEGAALFDTTDGLDTTDRIEFSSGEVTGDLHFTESGVHSLEFVAGEGTEEANAKRLIVRLVSGMTADYDYDDWADSYERAYDLPSGSLTDPEGDYNGNSVSNELEYLLDMSGADPVAGGSFAQVSVDDDGSYARMTFLRDLVKDPLYGEATSLQSGSSNDLSNWTFLTRTQPGLPNGPYETGAEEGNARSPFTRRTLRTEVPEGGRGFFRLKAD
ncbi:MAG: choice-of-anchor M domain-containing protein [Verrucomicrobiales bacterium]